MTSSRPRILMISPVVPALTGNGLAMRAAMTVEASVSRLERTLEASLQRAEDIYASAQPAPGQGQAVPDHICRDVEQTESADRWNDGVPFKSRWERKLYESGFAAGWDRARAVPVTAPQPAQEGVTDAQRVALLLHELEAVLDWAVVEKKPLREREIASIRAAIRQAQEGGA